MKVSIDESQTNSTGQELLPSRPSTVCNVCQKRHAMGHCPLKLAGVEHCGLCGLAHYGWRRTCPHISDADSIANMIGSLKSSTEPEALKEAALSYLRGVRGNLTREHRLREAKAQDQATERSQPSSVQRAQNSQTHYLLPLQNTMQNGGPSQGQMRPSFNYGYRGPQLPSGLPHQQYPHGQQPPHYP